MPTTYSPPRYEADRGFHAELRRRVRLHLEASGRPARGLVAMYVKTAVLGLWLAGSWLLLVFAADRPWQAALLALSLGLAVAGIGMNVQLAHCVPEAIPAPARAASWAVCQVVSSVDFARGSRLLGWYLGGLNFQIEHDLFPQLCHVHYQGIAPLVEGTCHEFGVSYHARPTFRAALASHFRLLEWRGHAELTPAVPPTR